MVAVHSEPPYPSRTSGSFYLDDTIAPEILDRVYLTRDQTEWVTLVADGSVFGSKGDRIAVPPIPTEIGCVAGFIVMVDRPEGKLWWTRSPTEPASNLIIHVDRPTSFTDIIALASDETIALFAGETGAVYRIVCWLNEDLCNPVLVAQLLPFSNWDLAKDMVTL